MRRCRSRERRPKSRPTAALERTSPLSDRSARAASREARPPPLRSRRTAHLCLPARPARPSGRTGPRAVRARGHAAPACAPVEPRSAATTNDPRIGDAHRAAGHMHPRPPARLERQADDRHAPSAQPSPVGIRPALPTPAESAGRVAAPSGQDHHQSYRYGINALSAASRRASSACGSPCAHTRRRHGRAHGRGLDARRACAQARRRPCARVRSPRPPMAARAR